MTVFYKVVQRKSKDEKRNGKYYGRVSYTETVTERDLATEIEKRSTVHLADALAVIAAMTELISYAVKDSKRVVLTGLGTFKMGASSKPADSTDDFKADNMYNPHILFQPETKRANDHTVTRAMTTGVQFMDVAKLTEVAKKSSSSGGGSSSSGDSSSSGGSSGSGSSGGSQSGEEEGGEHS